MVVVVVVGGASPAPIRAPRTLGRVPPRLTLHRTSSPRPRPPATTPPRSGRYGYLSRIMSGKTSFHVTSVGCTPIDGGGKEEEEQVSTTTTTSLDDDETMMIPKTKKEDHKNDDTPPPPDLVVDEKTSSSPLPAPVNPCLSSSLLRAPSSGGLEVWPRSL